MPCNNDSHSTSSSSEAGGTSNGSIIDAASPPSAHPPPPNNNNVAVPSNCTSKLEEEVTRRVNICDTNASVSHSSEQQNGGGSVGRIRSASTRSHQNIQAVFNYLHPLAGEELDNDNWIDMESCTVFLTQYRIIVVVHNLSAMCAIPLTGVDWLEAKDIVGLQLYCRDGRIIKLRAQNSESAFTWYKKLTQKTCSQRELSSIFAFKFYAQIKTRPNWLCTSKTQSSFDILKNEFSRLKLGDTWKITTGNKSFEICSTYPQYLIVPSAVDDGDLKQIGQGRHYKRLPTLVWRCAKNGAVLLRSSQPTISFFGTPNDKDVNFYHQIRAAISSDDNFRFLIADARSYTSALANRTKGGGFEPEDYYTNASVVFMGLPNIHYVRQSFHQLQQHLNSVDQNNFYHGLHSTSWLQYICQLFTASERCLNSLLEGVSVLVHCSDGWDRTTQIVSLCMLMVDPFYRTFEGFEMLIQRQWVEFGHKFGDRCSVLNGDCYEKSPVFLQFLDCVYQLWMKNQNQFQFNRRYLMKLMQSTFSGLFGTFLFNSYKEASENGGANIDPVEGTEPKPQRCFQVWQYLGAHNSEFENPAYDRKRRKALLEYPKFVQELEFWRDAYFCTQSQSLINNPECSLSSLHHNTGTGSTQDISSERTNSTLSRSQSAASLQSLEQNTTSFHSALGGSTFMNFSHANGTNAISSPFVASKLSDGVSISFPPNASSAEWKSRKFLDVDGLSKFPAQYEDYIIERDRERELQTRKTSPVTPNPPVRDLHSNGKMAHGGETAMMATSRRIRNESVDSSSYEIVHNQHFANGENIRMKHSSHNSTSSLTSGICLPSSCSSTCTTLSNELCAQNGFGCKNGILQEDVENGGGISDGIELIMLNGK